MFDLELSRYMRKRCWILPVFLTLSVLLTGCNLISGEVEKEHLKPINAADWPTPQPTNSPASPTPFPKAIIPPTVTPTAAPLPAADTPAPAEVSVQTAGPDSDLTALAQPVGSPAGSQLPMAGTGVVIAPTTSTRQGPGTKYGPVNSVQSGDLLGIMGKNAGGDWLYVIDVSLKPGWLPVSEVRVLGGGLTDAPVLPPNPMAALLAREQATTGAAQGDGAAMSSGAAPLSDLSALKPVTTAKVNQDVNLRQGPGAAYTLITTLPHDNQVSLLALNPLKDWALIETADRQQGWVYLNYLSVTGSLDTAPVIPASAFNQAASSNQAVPAGTINTPSPGSNTGLVASLAASNSASTLYDLSPFTMARIAINPVNIRPGPGPAYAPIDAVKQTDDHLAVLAIDQSRQWALVQPVSAQIGWAALSDLKLDHADALANAPQIYTAWVESNGVSLYDGPGIYDHQVGVLAIKTLVRVMGLDDTRSWALLKPLSGGGTGWAPLNFLKLSGLWADLPKASELPQPVVQAGQEAAAPYTPIRPVSESKIIIQTSSGGDIMVINPDGTGLHRLTGGIDPVLSPDGQTVAFTRWQGESGSLWLVNLDGSNEHQVIGNIKQAKGPDWSPDGEQIVLNFQDGGRLESKTDCFNLAKGDPPRPPRNATDIKVSIGPKGVNLCWKLPPDPHWGLRVIKIGDGSFKDVDGGTYAFRPAWDPARSWRIISDGGQGLLELDVNRDYRQTITSEVNDGSPVFSPDGRFIVVSLGSSGGGPGHDIFRLNADGTGRVRLTQTPLWTTAAPGDNKAWNNVAPTWSPDGKQIIFLTDRPGRWEIWTMNPDGADQHPLFSAEINQQLNLTYNFVDERSLSWR